MPTASERKRHICTPRSAACIAATASMAVERRLKAACPVSNASAAAIRPGRAVITHSGDLASPPCKRPSTDGYTAAIERSGGDPARKSACAHYLEIGAAFVILAAVALALQHFHLLPRGFSVSDQMSYGLVLLIGLVASVSSCLAVTGGLLVALAAKYNEANPYLTDRQRLTPHLYFNAWAGIISYTAARRRDRRARRRADAHRRPQAARSPAGLASMIVLGLNMLGLFPPLSAAICRAAAGSFAPSARRCRQRDQGRGIPAGRRHLLPALRLHSGAAALCAEQGELHDRRADDACLRARHAAGAALALGVSSLAKGASRSTSCASRAPPSSCSASSISSTAWC